MMKDWLGAYQNTLEEYKRGYHIASSLSCQKCILVCKIAPAERKEKILCSYCPESIHTPKHYDKDEIAGCALRGPYTNYLHLTNPIEVPFIRLKGVILYHELAVEWLSNNIDCTFEQFQAALVEINQNVIEELIKEKDL